MNKWTILTGAVALSYTLAFGATTFKDAPMKNTVLPPMYLSAVVNYDSNRRFTRVVVGSTRFLTCRDALDDTQSALALAAEYAPVGAHAEGICIPLHTYNDADLIQ